MHEYLIYVIAAGTYLMEFAFLSYGLAGGAKDGWCWSEHEGHVLLPSKGHGKVELDEGEDLIHNS